MILVAGGGAGRIDGVPAAILVAHAQAGEQDGVVADARALGICEPKGAIADPAHRRFWPASVGCEIQWHRAQS